MFSNFSELAAPQPLLQTTIGKSGYRNVCGLLLHAYIRHLPVVVFCVAIVVVTISTAVILVDVVSVVVFVVVVAEGVVTSPQMSSGGLLGPDLHPWQGFLCGEQDEWRMQAVGEEE